MKFGLLFRAESWWIGIHWSPYNKRLCINLVPMVTLWIAACDGKTPNQGKHLFSNTTQTHTYCRARTHGSSTHAHEF